MGLIQYKKVNFTEDRKLLSLQYFNNTEIELVYKLRLEDKYRHVIHRASFRINQQEIHLFY
jgi:hypothetical protein